jgi:hypothetical protein
MFKRRNLPTYPVDYPSGVCVKTEAGWWFINGKVRNRIRNARVLSTWNFPFVIESTEAALAKYPRASTLGFRDGSLVGDVSDGRVYLISQRKRRLLSSPEAYATLGLRRQNAVWSSHDEIMVHPEGEVLN